VENKFLINYRSVYLKNLIKNIFIFLALYLIFFTYQYELSDNNIWSLLFTNLLVMVVFIVSIINIKSGIYIFIFILPLLNSFTTILEISPISFPLFLFFALSLGFVINNSTYMLENRWEVKSVTIYESVIGKIILVFIILFTLSALISTFRYLNFFPFITNHYHDLIVNKKKMDSTGSIWTAINMSINYIFGFGIFFIIFNVFKKIREILAAILVFVFSTLVSFFVLVYQYFFNPYLGSFSFWVKSGRLNATFTDPNSLGAYTILLFPVFFVLIIFFKKWYLKLLSGLSAAALLVMSFLSGSRSALFGILIAMLVIAILGIIRWVKKNNRNKVQFSRLKKIILSVIIVFIIASMVAGAVGLFKSDTSKEGFISQFGILKRTIESVRTAIHYNEQSGFIESLKSISNYRYIFWGQAIRMAEDYPLSGVGIGSYILVLPNYLVMNKTNFSGVDYTGNYYLQILSELGIPGLILILSIFYFILKKVTDYFRYQKRHFSIKTDITEDREDWLLKGLFISFVTMLLAQFFGPHTNFLEIQLGFWIIIGLMLSYLKIKDENPRRKIPPVLKTSNRLKYSLSEKISVAVILFIFTSVFLFASVTTLSINVSHNLYDIKNKYHGWQNKYGFYNTEKYQNIQIRWTGIDASENVDKRGSVMIIPMRDSIPEKFYTPLTVKIFVDNLLVKSVKLQNNLWYDVKIDIPGYARDKFTITFVMSRSWVPFELGINTDTRELGIMVGDYSFQ
jgi:O-antigen ligase